MTKYHLWPDSNNEMLNIYLMGFRNIGLKEKIKDMSCLIRIHGVIDKFETNIEAGDANMGSTTNSVMKNKSQLNAFPQKSMIKNKSGMKSASVNFIRELILQIIPK
jgi:hypothetical protein